MAKQSVAEMDIVNQVHSNSTCL